MDAFRNGHVSRFPTGLVECDDLFAVRALWHTGMISECFLRKDQPVIIEPERSSRRLPAEAACAASLPLFNSNIL